MIRRQDDDFVLSTSWRFGKNWTAMVDHKWLIARKSGMRIGEHSDRPLTVFDVALQKRVIPTVAIGTVWAGEAFFASKGLTGNKGRCDVVALCCGRDPATRERVETELIHRVIPLIAIRVNAHHGSTAPNEERVTS